MLTLRKFLSIYLGACVRKISKILDVYWWFQSTTSNKVIVLKKYEEFIVWCQVSTSLNSLGESPIFFYWWFLMPGGIQWQWRQILGEQTTHTTVDNVHLYPRAFMSLRMAPIKLRMSNRLGIHFSDLSWKTHLNPLLAEVNPPKNFIAVFSKK